MIFRENFPLVELNTMRLGGTARFSVEVSSCDELLLALEFARERALPFCVLGAGSNVVAQGDFEGLVILNRIGAFERLDEDALSLRYRIGAGELWDDVVARLVAAGLSGVEAMSGIPGYAGATPVQNVGAYGQEIADVLVELEAYDVLSGEFVRLSAQHCGFAYRDSLFKGLKTRRHIITSLVLELSKEAPKPPFYPALALYLEERGIVGPDAACIREAVLDLRSEKLPDPKIVPNAGSFFKNPIVDCETAGQLLALFPAAPHWEMPAERVKLAAGWLIEQAGLKSFQAHGFQVYPKNALVVTHIGGNPNDAIESFVALVVAAVQEAFGITLEQEPEPLLPTMSS
ncbi:MAG: UDP-N-acetylmuramate dehydrogenase [Eggerthellaceae bacterium]|nr:UDP-N-acetylmuramate dehydrogenase [Eggerthellaceae bacterium]